ncbi:MAG TPA: nuclear transport factor 2 family protein [Dongiaceae bacterium]|nr:nuclear transport factor 2 family protein [Dongiaceae bacterium]
MKKLAALLIVITVLSPVRFGMAQQTPLAPCPQMSPDEMRQWAKEQDEKQQELISLEKEMARAMQWNTGTIFRRIYGEDFQGILPTGQIMDKVGWIGFMEKSGVKYSSFVASDIRVRMFQDTAVVSCLWSARGTVGDRAFSRQSRVTHVYVYGQQGWKTVSSQETLLPG